MKPKPPRFGGESSESFQEFLIKFESVGDLYGWNTTERKQHLIQNLHGKAFSTYQSNDPKNLLSYDQTIKVLKSNYWRRIHKETSKLNLQKVRQSKNMSIQDLYDRIVREGTDAYGKDVSGKHTDQLLKDRFIAGLADKTTRLEVMKTRPKTLLEAKKAAINAEAYLFGHEDGEEDRRMINAVAPPWGRQNGNGIAAPGRPDNRPRNGTASTLGVSCRLCGELGCPGVLREGSCRRRNDNCHHCRKLGHFSSHCPEKMTRSRSPANNQYPRPRSRSASPDPGCHGCGAFDHFVRDCPKRAEGARTPINGSPNRPEPKEQGAKTY